MLTLAKVYDASRVLNGVIRNTDLIYAPAIDGNNQVYIKTENLQLTGSFKVRGSYYKISKLSEEERQQGVIACSAGNHAQGVALAAQKGGIKATICIPDGAPISKVEATKSYGANVELVSGVYDDAYNRAIQIQQKNGGVFIHPFNDEDVIAGQGTIALEILNQLPDVDAVVVPVGGGGLISGIAFTIKMLKPNCKVYGVQAAGAPSMVNSIHDNAIQELPSVSTIADGIAVKKPGDITYELCSQYVDDFITVTEDEISTAILTLIERHKLIAEGAGAVSVAAALFNKLGLNGKKVVCVLSGGNIDVTILSRVINRGLIKSGRIFHVQIVLPDKPGQVKGISSIIADLGGNVYSIHHNRDDSNRDINSCTVDIVMETRDHAHIKQIKTSLMKAGYQLI